MGHSSRIAQYRPVLVDRPLIPLMNDTKWGELRLAMLEIEPSPAWSSISRETGYRYGPDSEWYHHFRIGGYIDFLLVDIATPDAQQRDVVRSALKAVHVPGEETPNGFRVYGYATEGQVVDYI